MHPVRQFSRHRLGGGVYNTSGGNLVMVNCSLSGNSAGIGGGVASDADTTLTMTGCILSTNLVGNGSGGGIFSGATLMLNQCTLSGNSAANGGGGINNAGALALTNCTLSGNSASATTYGGGGIYNSYNGSGNVTLNQCTLSGNWTSNTVVGGGGGLANNAGTLTLNQCTLSGNSASYTVEGGGGGIDNRSGPVTLYQCTVSGNSAPNYAEGGGIYNGFGGTVNLTNSIVAANSGPFGADIINYRILNYAGANIVESVDTVPFNSTQVNGPAPISAAPLLAPLGNYGGPTQTMPPLPGSPALDAGSDSATNVFATDQRGYPRLVGAHVDLGAVEGVYNSAGAGHLTSMARVGNGPASFTFTNSPYMSFTVLASTNAGLPLNAWSNLGAPVEAPSGSGHYQFTDAQATNSPQRFYCVRSP